MIDADARGYDSWPGFRLLNGSKAYVDTPMGQVHLRDIGPRDQLVPLILLHQTPMSMIEFGAIQASLAARGLRSIAVDTPGYGMSDHPQGMPGIAMFADNLAVLLDTLGLERVVVAGHHTGAFIAADFAARYPERSAAVILHGIAVFDPDELLERQAFVPWDRTPRSDMRHFAHPMRFRELQAQGRPLDAQEMEAATWMAIGLFMQGADTGHPAAFHHDLRAALAAIRAPGLILADELDSIYTHTVNAAKLRPDFEYRLFSTRNHEALMAEPDRWAETVAAFLYAKPTAAKA